MLKSLKIQNVALISEAEIVFGDRLNVMSGETGAGKSVVLESINFALGQKADKTMITNGQDRCLVVCVFDISDNSAAKQTLTELEIDYDDEIIIKRTLTSDGKSSIKLNGEAVNATMLRKVTSQLVDVHGQSDHFALLKDSNQLELIDGVGGEQIASIKTEISSVVSQLKAVEKSLASFGGNAHDRARRLDYLEYCIKEIETVDFKEGEDEELVTRKKKLANSEKIINALTEATEKLSGDGSAVDLVTEAERCVSQIIQYDETYSEVSDRLGEIIETLVELSAKLKDSFDFEFDAGEIDLIEDRLDKINLLKSKYGGDRQSILSKLNNFREEFDLLAESGANAERLEKERAALTAKLNAYYDRLTAARKAVSADISQKLSEKLKELAMKNAKFSVEFEKIDDVVSENGNDRVTFMFTANIGEPLKPLSKVISGGELSRLMLAIKTVTGDAVSKATYIFDEIDAGISGNAARVVAENFAQIAVNRQIIAISHLPQIVAMADTSLLIEKSDLSDRTYTNVIELSDEKLTEEVLRLIGGIDSLSGRAHAKEMIDRAREYKKSLKK